MNRIILLIGAAFILCSCYTEKKTGINYPQPFEFKLVDTIPGVSKSELFVRANEWVARTFNSAKDVVQMHDKEAGKIIAKGVISTSGSSVLAAITSYVSFTLSIDVKDEKCRLVISDFFLTEVTINSTNGASNYSDNYTLNNEGRPSTLYQKNWNAVRSNCYFKSKDMLDNFKKAIVAKSDNF